VAEREPGINRIDPQFCGQSLSLTDSVKLRTTKAQAGKGLSAIVKVRTSPTIVNSTPEYRLMNHKKKVNHAESKEANEEPCRDDGRRIS
jgi:hypothetical protein